MIIIILLEYLIMFLLGWAVLSQLIIPALRGIPLCPWFWSADTRLAVKLARLQYRENEQSLKEAIADQRIQMAKRQSGNKEN